MLKVQWNYPDTQSSRSGERHTEVMKSASFDITTLKVVLFHTKLKVMLLNSVVAEQLSDCHDSRYSSASRFQFYFRPLFCFDAR